MLARYVGWGALSQAFDPENAEWAKRYAELKELLSPEEWETAFMSTQYAHYTSREIINGMYAAMARFGFAGGNVIEAGGGVGNFIGLMPAEMRSGGMFTLVERERIAAGIAKHLYPKQNVQLADFTEFGRGDDGLFDVQIGNPPFARQTLTDKSGRKHLSGLRIHNYFIAKGIDLLRDGGIQAVVVSNGFLDAVDDRARKYIADRATFLGAIRLPNDAFKSNAGTEVTTDIVFFQKLPESEWGGRQAKANAKSWLGTTTIPDANGGEPIAVNAWLAANPAMMLGEYGRFGSMYGPDQPALKSRPGQDTGKLLLDAVAMLPSGIYEPVSVANTKKMIETAVEALHRHDVSEGGFYEHGGRLWQRLPNRAGQMTAREITPEMKWTEKQALGEKGFSRIQALAGLRDTLRQLIEFEMAGHPGMDAARARLNAQYDAIAKDGLLNDQSAVRYFGDDPDYPLLAALETDYKRGIGPAAAKTLGVKPSKSSAKKSAIFNTRMIQDRAEVESAETPEDAMYISIAERGRIDTAYIGKLLGIPGDEALERLTEGDNPVLFKDPMTGGYVLRDEYLSGNVRKKLAQAKQAGATVNAMALEAVIPEDVRASEISVRLGAPWVPNDVYAAFAKSLFGDGATAFVARYGVNNSFALLLKGGEETALRSTYGTPRMHGDEILSKLMNNGEIRITYTDSEGKTHTDKDATEMAQEKAAIIKERFMDWAFADSDRAEVLVRAYNDANNNYVPRTYDGSLLAFPGKVPVIKFRRHQRDFVSRVVQARTALADHVVGAGKTFAAIAAAMELRRTGLAKKPMIVVPNHLVKQWATDFYRLYPGAKILTATKKDFERINRRKFLGRIATGDWDAVIIAHSSFGFIKPTPEFESSLTQKEVKDIEKMIADIEQSSDDSKETKRTVKQLAARKERLQERIAALRDKPMDDLLDFGEIGVDQLFVDEAHMFKNLMFSTKMRDVRNLGDGNGSQRAFDMYIKVREVFDKNGDDRGVVFLTGTPVSNSLAEMYHVMRYLMPTAMAEAGFDSFDSWANTYASIDDTLKPTTAGGYKSVKTFGSFNNTPELLKMFDHVADTVTMEDIKKAYAEENNGAAFPLPKVKTGRRQPVALDRTPAQDAYMEDIGKRATMLENRKGPPKKGEDNHLKLMSDARKAAMDIRLVDPDVTEREAGARIDRAAGEIFDRWEKYGDIKGTQLVFSDLGTPLKAVKKDLAEYNELMAAVRAAESEDVTVSAALGGDDALDILERAEDAQAQLDAYGEDWVTAMRAAERGFSVYDDLRAALVERGIPAAQIAFIHDYNTDDQKAALFEKVNAGDIRVLLGSTQKMGAGTNVQQRLVALHHLDIPWRPSDIEQREGRIVRQGNLLTTPPSLGQPNPLYKPDFEVEILAYVTKDTLDKNMWDIQERKLKGINQLRTRTIEREIENSFEEMEMSASEMQAAATGNMDLLREITLRNDIQKLERKKRSHDATRSDLAAARKKAEADIKNMPGQIARAEQLSTAYDGYLAQVAEDRAKFEIDINGKKYTDRREAGAVLREIVEATVTDDEGKEKKAPIEVSINGQVTKNRTRVAELFSAASGDSSPILWTYGGTTMNRRADVAAALKQDIVDVVAGDRESAEIGSLGEFMVSVGDLEGDLLTVVVSLPSGHEQSASIVVANLEDGAISRSVVDAADRLIAQTRGLLATYQSRLASAKKTLAEIEKAGAVGDWPDEARLESMRQDHRALIKKIKDEADAKVKANAAALDSAAADAERGPDDAPLFSRPGSDTIDVDGVERPRLNSKGQPIHDTDEGIRNFWRWFGDSKAVDDQGRPLVVYHGTNADFSEFSASRGYTPGFWFATNADGAASVSSGGYVITAYLRVKNLTTLADLALARRDNSWVESVEERNAAVVSQLERAGFDGINDERFAGVGGKGKEVWAVFHPNQIKSVTGNVGDFSATDDRITFSRQRVDDVQFATGTDAMRQAVRDVLDSWDGDKPVVEILGTADEVPPRYRDKAGHWRTAEGFFAGGKAWVILGNNQNAARAIQTLRHEAVGHYGVERVLDGAWDGIVSTISALRAKKSALSKTMRDVLTEVERRYAGDVSPDVFAKELLAVMAEKNIRASFVDRVYAKVREFLRRIGLAGARVSEAEIRAIVSRAFRSVERGPRGPGNGGSRIGEGAMASVPERSDAAGRVAQVFMALAESDPDSLMRYGKSSATDLPAVVADILGDAVTVTRKGEVMQNFEPKVANAKARKVPAEKWSIKTADDSLMDVYIEGEHAGVPATGRRLFIDAALAESGKSMGSGVYAALFQYALNNDMVFTGDPSGLSDAALLRRTEHMLSAAIKHGTTRMMYPHPRQLDPADKNHGTSHTWLKPLQWKIGDDAANVASLLDTSTSNTMKLLRGTDANDYVYSLSLGRMLDARGEVVPKQRLVDLASQAGKTLQTRVKAAGGLGTEAVIGSTTVARAISAQSLIRQVQGRSSLLGDVAERLSRASLESDPLHRAFYSRPPSTEFVDTSRAYGGRQAYKRSKAAGRTKLSYKHWVLARTPSFKQQFGDWEALRAQTLLDAMDPVMVRVPNDWRGLDVASMRAKMIEALDDAITRADRASHPELGEIRIGRRGRDKSKVTSADPAKMLVVADIKKVLQSAVYAKSEAPAKTGEGIDGYGALLARVNVDGVELVARISVRHQPDGNWYYNAVTLQDAKEKAQDSYESPGTPIASRRPLGETPITGLDSFSRRSLARVNPDAVSKLLDPETGEPLAAAFSAGEPIMFSRPDSAAIDTGSVAEDPKGFLSRLSATLKPDNLSWKEAITAKLQDGLPVAFGALTLRHLADVGGKYLPQMRGYIDVLNRMQTDRNAMQEEGNAIAEKWQKAQRKDRPGGERLADVMHDATIAGVDPAKDYQPLTIELSDRTRVPVTEKAVREEIKRLRAQALLVPGEGNVKMVNKVKAMRQTLKQERARLRAFPVLVKRYNALSDEMKAIYAEARDIYERRADQTMQALEDRIQALEASPDKKRLLLAKMRAQFEDNRVTGPYFPLQRFGEFWIAATSPEGKREFFMYESTAEQLSARRELDSLGYTEVKSGRKIESSKDITGVGGAFMADLGSVLDDVEATDNLKSEIKDQIWQLYLRTLPELSQRKHFIHRKKVKGYSKDALRAFAANMNHGAYQIARLKHAHKLQNLMLKMKERIEEQRDAGTEANTASALYSEMSKRHDWVMNPQDSQLVNQISSLGFAWYLGVTPGAALVNLTQTAIVSGPVLAARFGAGKATRALMDGMNESIRTGGNIERRLMGEELSAYHAMRASGAIDKTQAHNLAGIAEIDTAQYNDTWHRVMKGISYLFHKAEVVNREATGMAAFRLARAGGMEFAAAVAYAEDVIWESHFDYSNANRARFMQSGAAKVLLMFRQYSLSMTYFLWRNFYQAFKGASPAVKKEARTKLMGVLGMTGVFAGALGMPLMSVMFGVANAAAAAFGDDDDEPFDAETAFRNFLADMLGADSANAIARGPVNALTGADIASRVSLDNLWLREPERELEGKALADYWLEQAAGPIFGGLFVNSMRGLQMIQEGEIERGVEAMTPKAVRDFMRTVRYTADGVQTQRGDVLIEDLSPAQLIMQAAGLSPAAVNERYDANNAIKNYEQSILDRRAALLDGLAMAIRYDDSLGRDRIMQQIRAFNRSTPELSIDMATIRRSLQARARYTGRASDGIIVNPRIEAKARAQGRFAEQ